MQEASAACEIKKGITRAELVDKMKTCIPEFYRKKKEGAAAKQSGSRPESSSPIEPHL